GGRRGGGARDVAPARGVQPHSATGAGSALHPHRRRARGVTWVGAYPSIEQGLNRTFGSLRFLRFAPTVSPPMRTATPTEERGPVGRSPVDRSCFRGDPASRRSRGGGDP